MNLSWAQQQRLVIGGIVIGVIVIIVAILGFNIFYKAPSCFDNIQNQGEQGVDCGGPCKRLCNFQVSAPVVRFTQPVIGNGVTSVIAYVDNPNASAIALTVPYSISLYDSQHVLAAGTVRGSLNLPPSATVPIFIPNIRTGTHQVVEAFTSIDPNAVVWQSGSDTRLLPSIGSPSLAGTPIAPRVNVSISNPSTTPIKDLRLVATLFDASGNVITATETLVALVPPQGSTVATFNWTVPFSEAPAKIDILPVIAQTP